MSTLFPPRRVNGFTLIELLIVITLIAILAALSFPVFTHAREKARSMVCQNHLEQLGQAALIYAQDCDETMMPKESGETFWPALILPYTRNVGVYLCPSDTKPYDPDEASGTPQSDRVDACSYGMNILKRQRSSWIGSGLWSPAKPVNGFIPGIIVGEGIPLAQVEDPTGTILFCDVQDELSPPNSEVAGIDAYSETDHGWGRRGPGDIDVDGRHSGGFNAVFGDGHVKWIAFGASKPQQWSVQDD